MMPTGNQKITQTTNMHRQIFSWPAMILVFVMVLAFICAWILGQLSLEKQPDSAGYISFARASLHETLTSVITLGYPSFLRALSIFNPTYSWLPTLQLLIHSVAVLCFFWALIAFGAPAAASCAASIALALSALNDGFFSVLGTDSIGQSLALLTIAGCFWAVARKKKWWPPILIALAALACYQVRPVYLMLIGFIPCLTFTLLILHPQSEKRFGFVVRLPAMLLALLLGPFLLFCSFRWATVGHFGLVSFSGWNQISITSEMLTVNSIRSRIPARWNELSSIILKERAKQGIVAAFQERKINYQQWRDNYDSNQRIALRSAIGFFGENPVLVNRLLSQFSKDLIKSSPRPYFEFVAKNIFRGIILEVINGQYVLIFGLALLILVFYSRQLVLGWRKQVFALADTDPFPSYVRDGLALGAGFLLIMKVIVVCLFENPIRRYIHPAGMLMPALIGLLLFIEIKLFNNMGWPCRKLSSKSS